MENHFDVIVLGTGSMGSSSCYYLSKSGAKVLGLDMFDPPHIQGSHSGLSRIIRKSYFEHPDYVPILERSYRNWTHLESVSSRKHFIKTGLVYFGRSDELLIEGVILSSSKYTLNLEQVDKKQSDLRFPEFKAPEYCSTVFETDAGFIETDKAISDYLNLASQHGCQFLVNTKVSNWNIGMSCITLHTDMGSFTSDKLVITAGAWSKSLLSSIKPTLPISVSLQSYFYIQPAKIELFKENIFPCWNMQIDEFEGLFYGFPYKKRSSKHAPYGLKIAHHSPGIPTDPNSYRKQTNTLDRKNAITVLNKYIPNANGTIIDSGTCLYNNSADENFIIDYYPGSNQKVVFACGFSGHGFKFVPAIGEILAGMINTDKKPKEIDFLSLDRFQNI